MTFKFGKSVVLGAIEKRMAEVSPEDRPRRDRLGAMLWAVGRDPLSELELDLDDIVLIQLHRLAPDAQELQP